MRLLDTLKKLVFKEKTDDSADVEELRIAFKARYHNFKLLLNANNRALETMADIEQALYGTYPFGMSFVRSSCTAVSVNVFHMIKNLDELSPHKYHRLYDRFNDIQREIDHLLTRKKVIADERFTIHFSKVNRDLADLVGSKMANLGEIKNRIHLNVPGGFVISAHAYHRFLEANDLQTEIDRRFQVADVNDMQALYTLSSEIQQLIIRSKIPADLSTAFIDAWAQLEGEVGKPVTVALRSSALGEDTSGSSFAGQYRSVLNVSAENLFQAYKEIVSSKYSLQAISYRLNKGFKDDDISMPVGCLAMVNAISGGVIYSRNPVDISDDSLFINAAWGLPKSVVDGSMDCDLFVVSRQTPMKIIKQEIKEKGEKYVCYPQEGICRIDLTGDDAGKMPSIDQEHVLSLAEIAVNLEEYYGSPQDIEWAIDDSGAMFILQCRPLLQMEKAEKPVAKNYGTVIATGGVTASPGVASGIVHRVSRGEDVLQFPQGAILVTQQAIPRWASLLNRAAAVVTEKGGFAGHLANVAREFGVPALFGIQGIMEKLTNGDIITVDANGLTLYQGKVEALSVDSEKKNFMVGSPVYKTLKQLSAYIVPLNLLDPDSRDFNPDNCRTFHDITRFIHEKSVHEMFNFGREHNFSERSGKQLHYKVPMQWWILNLDDGFKEEVKGRYVRLENIDCIPMLEFWEGFAAVPWDGPPPIDGRGMASVMFRATTNTALTTGVRSKYSERNYFMISKNYLSLNSRLGFHFSTLEALISDRSTENYISFQFKGGAANYERCLKRVTFIGDILEEYGFRVDIKEDTLISRLEDHEKAYMLERIKILGYLTIHTRQLDMIMANPELVEYYRLKIHKDIQALVGCLE